MFFKLNIKTRKTEWRDNREGHYLSTGIWTGFQRDSFHFSRLFYPQNDHRGKIRRTSAGKRCGCKEFKQVIVYLMIFLVDFENLYCLTSQTFSWRDSRNGERLQNIGLSAGPNFYHTTNPLIRRHGCCSLIQKYIYNRPVLQRNNLVNRVVDTLLKLFAGSYSAYKYVFLSEDLNLNLN